MNKGGLWFITTAKGYDDIIVFDQRSISSDTVYHGPLNQSQPLRREGEGEGEGGEWGGVTLNIEILNIA